MTLLNPAQLLAAITTTEQLVPAPRMISRALKLLRAPDAALPDIAKLINQDPALAANLLRCANSAYHGRNQRVSSVTEAVQVLGLEETVRQVTMVAIQNSTNHSLGSYGIAADDFWLESLFNGILMHRLAAHTRAVEPVEAYTAGLLRFIGRLAINQAVQNLGGGLFWDGSGTLGAWEIENVGRPQTEIGAGLLRKWEFPSAMVAAVELQDAPDLTAAAASIPLVQMMRFVARLLPAGIDAAALEKGSAEMPAWLAEDPFASAHQMTAEQLTEILIAGRAEFVAVRDSFNR